MIRRALRAIPITRGTGLAPLIAMAATVGGLLAPVEASAATLSGSISTTVSLGGILPLGTPTCTLCANFVSTFDRDGSAGPATPVTRMHRNIVPNIGYALDVDGDLPPVPLGLLPLPGYELSATVRAVTADRPTIKLSRFLTAPASMPLRIEIVTGEVNTASAAKTTFGYDTLDSTAPHSFTAALDLTDRDQDATSANAFADLTLDGAGKRLTVVTEGFTGPPEGARSDRNIRRLTYRGDPTAGTAVPGRASIDVTGRSNSQRVVLTRNVATTFDVELVKPAGGQRVTGTLDQLPAWADLTVAQDDVNGDGRRDKRFTYVAAASVKQAALRIDEGSESSRASVIDLPSEIELTYASRDNGTPKTSDDNTEITYHSNGRATHAQLRREDGPNVLDASMDRLPANINLLRYQPRTGGGHVVYRTDGRADQGMVEVRDGAKRTKALVTNLPGAMDLDWSSTDAGGAAHYVADAAAHKADIELDDEQGQKTTIGLRSGDGQPASLPSDVRIDYTKSDAKLDFQYRANAEVPAAEIHGTNFRGLPDDATELHLVLTRVPTGVGLLVTKGDRTESKTNELPPPEECWKVPEKEAAKNPSCPQNSDYKPLTETITTTTTESGLDVTTPGGRLGKGEIQLTSGPDQRLPTTAEKGNPLDGLMLQDLREHFVVFARVSEFDQLGLRRGGLFQTRSGPGLPQDPHEQSFMHAWLDTAAEDHALALDIDKASDEGQSVIESTDALLVTLPAHIELETSANSTFGENTTKWTATRPVDGWWKSEVDGVRRPAFQMTERVKVGDQSPVLAKTVTLDPMPANFSACQVARLDTCSERRFDDNLAHLREGRDWAYRTLKCAPAACDSSAFPIDPNHAGNGSFLLKADTPTTLSYLEGDTVGRQGPFTKVFFRGLMRFGLQGHKYNYPCSFGSVANDCKAGYVAMDTGGQELTGRIEQQGEDSFTRLVFPEHFFADRLVWAFNKTGAVSGRVASVGSLHCPDKTEVQLGGETLNERFCNGDLFEGTILDQI